MKETAIFGGGCFWCTEAVFGELKGVISVMPGYAGGTTKNPTYDQVCTGTTGHAEVTKVEFDPSQITYTDLLTVFFATHNPTTRNRQPARLNDFSHSGGGNDTGTQYRSIVLYTTPAQKADAEKIIEKLNTSGPKVVTEVKPLDVFYPAEEYHRQYYKNNTDMPYCQVVINPKLEHVKERFHELLKTDEKK